MGLFGGDSSSAQTTVTNVSTTTTNANQAGANAAVTGSNNRVSVLDAGAVQGGLSIARSSLDLADRSVDGAFNLSTGIVRSLIDSQDEQIGKALQFAENSSRASNEFASSVANPNQEAQKDVVKTVVYGVAALGVAVVFIMMSKK